MKKIVFGITSMNIGGAEKVLVDLISSLKSDYDITLFTIYKKGILLNSLDKDIKVVGLVDKKYEDLSFVMKKILGISFFFKPIMYLIYSKYIKNKFDTEVAFLEGPITNLFSFKSKANKIAWVHTDISKHFKSINRYKNYYDKYNKIVFVSKDSLEGFNSVIVNNVEKLVIHNYIDKNRVKNLSRSFVVKEIDNKMLSYNKDGEVFYINDIYKGEYTKLKYLGYDKQRKCLRYGFNDKRKKEVFRIPINIDRRMFLPVARDSKKFKRLYKKRTEVERLNGRIDRDYMFNDHFIRGKKKMNMMLSLTFIIMLGMAKGHILNKKDNIRSLVKI